MAFIQGFSNLELAVTKSRIFPFHPSRNLAETGLGPQTEASLVGQPRPMPDSRTEQRVCRRPCPLEQAGLQRSPGIGSPGGAVPCFLRSLEPMNRQNFPFSGQSLRTNPRRRPYDIGEFPTQARRIQFPCRWGTPCTWLETRLREMVSPSPSPLSSPQPLRRNEGDPITPHADCTPLFGEQSL